MHLLSLASPTRIAGLALFAVAVGFGSGSLMLGLWAYGMPGIGLTPLIASIGLLPISICMVVADSSAVDDGPYHPVPLLVGLGFCAYVLSLSYLGLIVPTFVFMLVWSWLIYRRSWLTSLIAATAIAAGVYVLFVVAFGIPVKIWPV